MLRDITFGQYYQAPSVIHRLDPRIKIILLILQIVFVFIARNFISLALIVLTVLFELSLTLVPIKLYLKNLKAILPILIFTVVLNLFYGGGSEILIKFWIITVTKESVFRSVFLMLRIVVLIISGSILTYTTSPNDLTDGIEKLLTPLNFIGLKSAVHTLAMMMTITLRFIPTLVEETDKIINAQKARGADFESGSLMSRIRALIPILIPLLISAFRRAFDLAEAMQCRCYHGCEGRVRMKRFQLSVADFISVAFLIAVCIGILTINLNLSNFSWSL